MKKKFTERSIEYFNKVLPDFKILLVTATPLEKEILQSYLKPIKDENFLVKISKGKQTYFLGLFGKYNVIHVACGDLGAIGRESSIITTSTAISDCNPKIVLMPGVAFGINRKKQKIGYVLVSERVIPYEPQRVGKSSTGYRGKEGPASSLLLNRFRNSEDWIYLLKTGQAEIIIGEVLSGEKLIDNVELKKLLAEEFPNAKGGEMEGAGVYAACDGFDIHWILVKGICDFADGNKSRNKETNQKIAANSAVSLCEHVFNLEHSFESLGIYPHDIKKESLIIDHLNKQVNRQLKKQIHSGKYLQNTFIETGQQKDNLRYLCDSIFYSEKCYEEISLLDFRLLNSYLKKDGLPKFDLAVEDLKIKPEEVTVSNFDTIINKWSEHIRRKKQEVVDIKLSSNEKSSFEYKFRDPIDDIDFLKARVALITESAGQGKTNFLCDFSENFLLKRQIPSLFLTGVELNASNLRMSILQRVFPDGVDCSFTEFLEKIKDICYSEKKFFVLIIDGINENINSKILSQNLESLISELLEHDFIKLVISCRTEYYDQNFKNLEKSSFVKETKKITSLLRYRPDDNLKEKLFDTYFQHFNIKYRGIADKAYDQLVENFLLLRIFCEAHQNESLEFIDNIYKEKLFEKYYLLKCDEINKRIIDNDEFKIKGTFDIRNFISNVIEFMIRTKTYVNVPFDKIISDTKDREMYVRFLDENILIKRDIEVNDKGIFTESEVVNFTFDEFRDFLISRYLVETLYKTSMRKFKDFLKSEITEKSPLLEGCSTFLFFVSRRGSDKTLNDIISSQPWFEQVFSKCIFSLVDSQVTKEDKETLKSQLLNNSSFNDSIIYNLICRYNTERYQQLNLEFLFEIIRELDSEHYLKVFQTKFGNDRWEYSKINEDSLIDEISSILEEKEILENSHYHKLFELLVYMFTKKNWKIQNLYEKYYFKHSETGKSQLKKALESKNAKLIEKINIFISEYEIRL